MAANEGIWNFEVENIPYMVELKKNTVSINNTEPVKLNKLARKTTLLGTDYSIMLEGKEAILHIRSLSAPVLSYDGKDCATGEEYIPTKVPVWTWIFIVLHALNFFLILGGALGGAIQGLVIILMASIASNQKKSTGMRILICAGIWILSSIVQFILALGFASIRYY